MKSTNSNLLNLVYRLLASGIILFISTEVVLAYVFAFHLIPSSKAQQLSKETDAMRVGIEIGTDGALLADVKHSGMCSFSKLSNSYESYVGFKHNLLDAVKTDQLTARILMDTQDAKPFAFLFDEESRSPLKERLILVTKNEKVDFFEQTEGLSIVVSSTPNGIERIVFGEFLNKRTGDYRKWFKEVTLTVNDNAALDKVLKGQVEIAAVSEKNYKQFLIKNGEQASSMRILWYSNPFCRNVIMVKKDLSKDQLSQLKSIILEEDDDLFKWFLFDESLQELTKWKFTIRGRAFDYGKDHFSAGTQL